MRKKMVVTFLFWVMVLLISSCGQLDTVNKDIVNVENSDSVLLKVLTTKNDFDDPSLTLANAVITQEKENLPLPYIEKAAYGINGEYTMHGVSYYVNFVHRLWMYKYLIPDNIDESLLYSGIPVETSALNIDSMHSSIYSKCGIFETSKFKQCSVVFKHKNFLSIFTVDISKDIENPLISNLINPILSKIVSRINKYENSIP